MYLDKPVTGRTQLKRTFSGFKTAILKADARPLQRDVHTVLRLPDKKNMSFPNFILIIVRIGICLDC